MNFIAYNQITGAVSAPMYIGPFDSEEEAVAYIEKEFPEAECQDPDDDPPGDVWNIGDSLNPNAMLWVGELHPPETLTH